MLSRSQIKMACLFYVDGSTKIRSSKKTAWCTVAPQFIMWQSERIQVGRNER